MTDGDGTAALRIERVNAAATYELRAAVLRAGDIAAVPTPLDFLAEAVHLAASQRGRRVGVLVIAPRQPDEVVGQSGVAAATLAVVGERPWQLRGMAVAPDVRSSGIGSVLLAEALRRATQGGGTGAWANARLPALNFYERAGLHTVGDGFDHVGSPHRRIARSLVGFER